MLQFFRSNAKGMLGKVIVGTITVIFTLWGANSIVAISSGDKAPVSVNGVDITEYQISQMTDIQKRNIQAQLGESFDPDLINDAMIRDSVIQALIQQQLEWQTSNDMGMAFSDEAITEIIVTAPVFQVDGKFDKDTYTRLIGQYGYSPKDYVNVVRQDLMNSQLKTGLINSGFILDSEVKAVAHLEDQTRDVSVLAVNPADFADDVVLEDDAIQAYYDQNRVQYRTEESLVVDYVILSRNKLAESMKATDAELAEAYEIYKQQQLVKIEKTIAHILITSENHSDSDAKELLTELKERIAAGESFEDLAKQYSEDPGSSDFGGDLGAFTEGAFVAEFDDAVNAMSAEGDITGPIKTDFGFHLIKLTKLGSPVVAPMAEVKSTLRNTIIDRKTADEMLLLHEDLTNLAFSDSNLNAIADQFELTIETSEVFTRSGGPGIFSDSNVAEAAFAPTVVDDNENSEVVTLSDGSLMVMHLNSYQQADIKPLADVRDSIVATLTVSSAQDLANEYAITLMDDIKSSGNLDVETALEWTAYPAIARSGSDLNEVLVGRAFAMAKPASDGFSIDRVTTQDGVVSLVVVTAVYESDDTKDVTGFDDYLGSLISESEYTQWFEGIASDAKISYK